MQITVKLFASFRVGRFAETKQEYVSGTCIADVIRDLQIEEREIGMIMLNGRHVEPNHELQDGVNLSLFPLLGGG
jgi:molybdopterin synthase sulfur carrier subunit